MFSFCLAQTCFFSSRVWGQGFGEGGTTRLNYYATCKTQKLKLAPTTIEADHGAPTVQKRWLSTKKGLF